MNTTIPSTVRGIPAWRAIVVIGMAVAMVLMAALPSSAAPNNKNNEDFLLEVECTDAEDQVLDEWSLIRPNPGRGLPAWDTVSGALQVGKNFSVEEQVTVEILSQPDGSPAGQTATAQFTDGKDHGSSNGNKELITCTTILEDGLVVFEDFIDPGFAEMLNADFATDIFKAGQEVRITVDVELTVLAMVPGRR